MSILVVLSVGIPSFGPSGLACTWPAEEARSSDKAVNSSTPEKHKTGRFRIAALKQARGARKTGEHWRRVTSEAVGASSAPAAPGHENPIKRACLTNSCSEPLYAGYLIRMRLDDQRLCPGFVRCAFEEPGIRREIERLAKSTSGVNNINSEQLKALNLPLPPLQEQLEIVRRVEMAFAQIDRTAAEAERAVGLLDLLDQAVLARAFRGELVTQDPNDEPASELLERIRPIRLATPKQDRGVVTLNKTAS